jgi:DNA-binding PadR family transcriptional regulator
MIEELAEHGYSLNASQLYPRFHRLQEQGFLTRSDRVTGGKLRKYYRITRPGSAHLKEQKRRLMELISEALTTEELSEALRRRQKREEGKRISARDGDASRKPV